MAQCQELVGISAAARERVVQKLDIVDQLRQMIDEMAQVHVRNMTIAGACRARHKALVDSVNKIREREN